ncbi:MAG TPA: hypothetical protein VHY84_17335 [Bryobacteraceae bacterium]|jgi:hypothetical protein|nr:hypothetical protein [Bryobacteraceae bacterium]
MRKSLRAACAVALAVTAWGQQAQDWKLPILQKLLTRYRLTQATFDKTDIVTAGSVITLRKNGLVLFTIGDRNQLGNNYANGVVKPALPYLAAHRIEEGRARAFVVGEKLWLTRILFEAKGDGILLEFLSDPYDDGARYWGTLKFSFPKNSPPSPDDFASKVNEVIGVVLTAQELPATESVAPIAPPPPLPNQPIAPPPTIELGQTKDQIVAIMGQPERIANVGAKQTYFYKDLKITLTAGKVTDIE